MSRFHWIPASFFFFFCKSTHKSLFDESISFFLSCVCVCVCVCVSVCVCQCVWVCVYPQGTKRFVTGFDRYGMVADLPAVKQKDKLRKRDKEHWYKENDWLMAKAAKGP